eukprot:2893974-Pyramimonas_sp.AAC.1
MPTRWTLEEAVWYTSPPVCSRSWPHSCDHRLENRCSIVSRRYAFSSYTSYYPRTDVSSYTCTMNCFRVQVVEGANQRAARGMSPGRVSNTKKI